MRRKNRGGDRQLSWLINTLSNDIKRDKRNGAYDKEEKYYMGGKEFWEDDHFEENWYR